MKLLPTLIEYKSKKKEIPYYQIYKLLNKKLFEKYVSSIIKYYKNPHLFDNKKVNDEK